MKTLESTNVTSVVCDKGMEMMKRRLHLWIHEMTINLKNVALRIVVRSKILILLSPRVKKKVKLFLAVLAS